MFSSLHMFRIDFECSRKKNDGFLQFAGFELVFSKKSMWYFWKKYPERRIWAEQKRENVNWLLKIFHFISNLLSIIARYTEISDGWNGTSRGWILVRARNTGTTCFQDIVLFIVMLQMSVATSLYPSDWSIIQPAHECVASGLQVRAHPPYRVDFAILILLINQASTWELVIYSEVIMFCFNHSLTDNLTLSTQQFGQEPPPPRQALSEGTASSSSRWLWEVTI